MPRSVIRNAVRRVAATRAKVAEEKRQEVIALVRQEIAEHARRKGNKISQSKAEPEADIATTDNVAAQKKH